MARTLAPLADREFDLLVIGGGVAGAATAWDAALRGLSVALLERGDFGGATSAESLKVVHGGVRYLQHLDIVRVRESARERRALPPGRATPGPSDAVRHPGLRPWDEGAGNPGGRLHRAEPPDRGPERRRRRPDAAHSRGPDRVAQAGAAVVSRAAPDGLTGAGVFWDGQMQNPPRLVWSMVRAAARAGAIVANRCEVTALLQPGRPGHRRRRRGPHRPRAIRRARPGGGERGRALRRGAAAPFRRAQDADHPLLPRHGAGAEADRS